MPRLINRPATVLIVLIGALAGCRAHHPWPYQRFDADQTPDWQTIDVQHVAQTDARSCGAACLEMILRYWQDPVAQKTIQAQIDEGHEAGVAAKDLKRFAESRGFHAFVVRGTTADLLSFLQRDIPLIVARRTRYNKATGNHYIVATGFSPDKDYLVLDDPAKGPLQVRLEDFLADWSQARRFLMVVVPKGHDAAKDPSLAETKHEPD